MKKIVKVLSVVVSCCFLFIACGPKPQYRTRLGKKKLKHYNSIQYDRAEAPKTFKSFKNR